MCDPVSIGIASIGLTAGSSAMSYISQKNEADRQNAANAEYAAKNKQAAIEAANYNLSELTLRQSEEALAASTQIDDLTKEANSKVSTAYTAAAEAGVSGNSLDAVIADVKSKYGTNKTRTEENLQMKEDQLQREKTGVLVDAQNNINLVKQTVVRGPSILTPILQTGASALGFANHELDRQAAANGDH